MAPWIAILVGAVFIWLAVRIGFYETWCFLVNSAISIYVAVFLAPMLMDLAPVTGSLASYSTALSMLVLAGGCFAILYGFSYVFLTGQFSIPFPRVFDVLLAGGLGFLTGFLLWSFATLVFTTTPVAQQEFVSDLGFNRESEKINIACVARCCNVIHSLTGFDTRENPGETAIHQLLDRSNSPAQTEDVEPPDPNAPAPVDQHVQGRKAVGTSLALGPQGSS